MFIATQQAIVYLLYKYIPLLNNQDFTLLKIGKIVCSSFLHIYDDV